MVYGTPRQSWVDPSTGFFDGAQYKSEPAKLTTEIIVSGIL